MTQAQIVPTNRIQQWGVYAFAVHCRKLGISIEDCLDMVRASHIICTLNHTI